MAGSLPTEPRRIASPSCGVHTLALVHNFASVQSSIRQATLVRGLLLACGCRLPKAADPLPSDHVLCVCGLQFSRRVSSRMSLNTSASTLMRRWRGPAARTNRFAMTSSWWRTFWQSGCWLVHSGAAMPFFPWPSCGLGAGQLQTVARAGHVALSMSLRLGKRGHCASQECTHKALGLQVLLPFHLPYTHSFAVPPESPTGLQVSGVCVLPTFLSVCSWKHLSARSGMLAS